MVEYKALEGAGDIVDKESVTKGEKEAIDEVANAHVVRSVTKSNEFPQKRDQWKMYRTYMYFKGLYSLKLFTMGF